MDHRLLLRCTLGWSLLFAISEMVHGAEGVIYYNRIPSLTSPAALRRVNADGSADEAVAVNLPSALYPIASRDGRRLLLTSSDPGRPFKLSNNVFVYDLASAAGGRITSFEDIVTLNNKLVTNDLGSNVANRAISAYTINFPYHKAFSPDGSRVVVMNLRKSGGVSRDTPVNEGGPNDLTAGSGRFPTVEIYRVADGQPEGAYVFLGVERTGFNQGGDGVDWHPARHEVVASVSSDIPATGTAGRTGTEGTVLALFGASGPSQFLRKLTAPTGQADVYIDVFTVISTSSSQHDYAPAISADGQQVAYVRHTLRQDNRYDGAGIAPLPARCSIRLINYDGTGDREVLRLADGLWVTRVTWSPDGTQLAFDLAPQVVLNGWNSLLGDVTRSEIHVMGIDGSTPTRRLAQAPAAFPTWAPDVASNGTEKANVTPFHLNGWSSPMVVSRAPGNNISDPDFSDDQDIWVDWAIANLSLRADIAPRFFTELLIDDVFKASWFHDGLGADTYNRIEDFNIGKLPAGQHVFKLATDHTSVVDEANEADNTYQVNVRVLPSTANKHVVLVSNFKYDPASLTIKRGDVVDFRILEGSHTATGIDSDPFCGNAQIPGQCSVTFNQAGVFPYRCLFHSNGGPAPQGMVGQVRVIDSILVEKATAVEGPYTSAIGAEVNYTNQTISVAVPGGRSFWRLNSAIALRIASVEVQSSTLVLRFQ